jgi:hypothetical protein
MLNEEDRIGEKRPTTAICDHRRRPSDRVGEESTRSIDAAKGGGKGIGF